ncbi:hypothetical protein SPI_02283 [Niveomyces insectorum RCEF 264]|uniref:Transmembrane protein n=1 Tax=Niveomyces insectorum RCEF 264 TaxID=1081102 RepID=A0A167XWJ8_9HYPO|nr:hypothetical protein SPI_02283 [Niveomyces insectorum RCEF 264]
MDSSTNAIQNFSLPGRLGHQRAVTPSRLDTPARYATTDDGHDRGDKAHVGLRPPSPAALQLFQFGDGTSSTLSPPGGRHHGPLPRLRPLSTSSSAPVLPVGFAMTASTSSAIVPANKLVPDAKKTTAPSIDRRNGGVKPNIASYDADLPRPPSPALSVCPARPPPGTSPNDAYDTYDTPNTHIPRFAAPLHRTPDYRHRDHDHDHDRDHPSSLLSRSVSVRCGHRVRRVSLRAFLAADDAARRVVAVRRARRVVWLLAGTALAGLLSSTAAVTLAAAQAAQAAQAAWVDENANKGDASSRPGQTVIAPGTLAWLIASVAVGVAAAVGVAIMVTGSRAGRPTLKNAASRPWVEMDDLRAGGSGVADDTDAARPWWWPSSSSPATQPVPAINKPTVNFPTTTGTAFMTAACDNEDRNWARFARDPVRLRRYVETLEARLAAAAAAVQPEDKLCDEVAAEHQNRTARENNLGTTFIHTEKEAYRTRTAATARTAATTASTTTATHNAVPAPVKGGPPMASANSLLPLLRPPRSRRNSTPDSESSVSSLSSSEREAVEELLHPSAAAGDGTHDLHAPAPASAQQTGILTQLSAAYANKRSF